MGTIDHDNRIFIRGRSKTMILGASGQNIYPEEIESKLNNLPFVMESLVVEKNGKLIGMVYPDYDTVDSTGISHTDLPVIMEQNRIELNKAPGSLRNDLGDTIVSDRIRENTEEKALSVTYTVIIDK